MDYKLAILSSDAQTYSTLLAEADLPNLTIEVFDTFAENNQYIQECDIIFGAPDRVSRAIPYAHNLKWVQSMWAGITPLLSPDLSKNYTLTGVKGIFGPVMAEYVFCYLLMHERKAFERYQHQLEKVWDETPPGTLQNKLLGIMGLGSIGVDVAKMAKNFGMKTYGYSRSQTSCDGVDQCFIGDQLIDFVKDLDYLFCVLPNTPETTGLINKALLMQMRKTAVIVNAGRGNLIDQDALADALEQGQIGGAVLDVFLEEPLPSDHRLWQTPNTIITSHTAAMSVPTSIAPIFIDNYQRFIAGRPLQYTIDFERGY
ncbi:D-2-hydroxyacid dehydrogenase [Psychromonas sp. PT13]|uniref:D-2-hydroxyacid dehydrogenase n=1 Tax=Psychromonas sp. PT13 TaxID=3439547 RepID=UPI003EBB8A0C